MNFRAIWGFLFGRVGNVKRRIPFGERIKFVTPDRVVEQIGWMIEGWSRYLVTDNIVFHIFKDGQEIWASDGAKKDLTFSVAPEGTVGSTVSDGSFGGVWGNVEIRGGGLQPLVLDADTEYEFMVTREEGWKEGELCMVMYRCTRNRGIYPEMPELPDSDGAEGKARGVWIDGVQYVPKG